jgi:drug/metabolite transporter (DMT)-like permease
MTSSARATGAGLLAILIWSTSIGVTRLMEEKLGLFTYCSVLYLGSGCFLATLDGFRKRDAFHSFRVAPRFALFCGVPFVLYALGYNIACLLPARELLPQVALANYLWPALILLLSVPILGNRARWLPLLAGTALALGGLFVSICKPGFFRLALAEWPAFSLMLGSALLWALYSNLAKLLNRPGTPNAVALFQLCAGAAFVAFRFFSGEDSAWDWSLTPYLAYAIFFLSGLGYFFWEIGMKDGDQILLGSVSYGIPVTSTLFTCLVLGQSLTLPLLAGCALVVIGATVSRKGVSARAAPE